MMRPAAVPLVVAVTLASCATGESLERPPAGEPALPDASSGGSAGASAAGAGTGGGSGGTGAMAGGSGGTTGGAAGGDADVGGDGGSGDGGMGAAGGGTDAGNGGSAGLDVDAGSGGVSGAAGTGGTGGTSDAGGPGGTGGTGGTGGVPAECTPSETQCSGDTVQTCSATGQWGSAAACGGGETCHFGACACRGVTATLSTEDGGNCTEIDSASEVNGVFSSPEARHNISSGWSFDTQQPDDQSPSGAGFGFEPPFTSTAIGWSVRYQGYLMVPQAGQYCFRVDIGSPGGTSPPDACGAIYIPNTANAFVMNGRRQGEVSSGSRFQTRCTTFSAPGPQPIQLVYRYSSNNPAHRHHFSVQYCFGGASACTDYAPITADVLTPFDTTLACPGN